MGAVSPALAQYEPGVQDTQTVTLDAPVTLLYVPAGHSVCVPVEVRAVQYAPAGHVRPSATGSTVPWGQNHPAGQSTHVERPEKEL